jgi:hypothetical protein
MSGRRSIRLHAGRSLTLISYLAVACANTSVSSETLAESRLPRNIALVSGKVSVQLFAVAREPASPPSIGARVRDTAGKQLYLDFVELTAQREPGATFNVYLNLPADKEPQGVADPRCAGTFGFFNAFSGRPRDVALNVTPVIQRLAARGELNESQLLTVTIVSAGTLDPTAGPQIRKIVLIAQ